MMKNLFNPIGRTLVLSSVLGASALFGTSAYAVPTFIDYNGFSEDFNSGTGVAGAGLDSLFESSIATGFKINESGSGTLQNIGTTRATRNYIRTGASDFNLAASFVFEITINVSDDTAGNGDNGISWIGLGSGVGSGAFNEVPGAGFRIEAGNVSAGRLGFAAPFVSLSTGTGPGNGTHRSRVSSDGTVVTFAYDADYIVSTGFVSDFTHTVTLALLGFDSTNSHLYFGGTANATFDDISISATQTVPEPTTTALLALGLLGAGFARKRQTQ